VVEEYLRPFADANVDSLVLGCTHYPLLKPLFADVLGPRVTLIDSAAETAAETARTLVDRQIATSDGHRVIHRFIASDDPDQFLQLGQRFLGAAIERVEIRTLG
jgi:glutamate racemase